MNTIVVTTIYDKDENLEKLDNLPDWHLVVVTDKKTPTFGLKNGTVVTCDMQEKLDKKLSDLIGWNCIQRRSMGYVFAHKELQPNYIANIDSDNLIYDGWGKINIGKPIEATEFQCDEVAFDPIGAAKPGAAPWHRGFPLQLVPKRSYKETKRVQRTFDVQANFWDGDPDIDAICRITQKPCLNFSPERFPFCANKIAPFNSQNTIVSDRVLPHYFMLPAHGRADDIHASYHVQAQGFRVLFDESTVYQARNPHDLTKNLKDEFAMYTDTLPLLKALETNPMALRNFVSERTLAAFRQYQTHFRIEPEARI